eukprot:jgi/Hompol1/49/HPOL_002429-RA
MQEQQQEWQQGHQNEQHRQLLQSLGLGGEQTPWADAESRFLEIFYGKEFVLTYENIREPAARSHAKVSFEVAKPLRQQQRKLKHDTVVASGGRIVRPHTAELAPDLRRTLAAFPELDSIAFVRPLGLGTPAATPMPSHPASGGVASTSANTLARSESRLSQHSSGHRHPLRYWRKASAGSVSERTSVNPIRPISRDAQRILASILGREGYIKLQQISPLSKNKESLSTLDGPPIIIAAQRKQHRRTKTDADISSLGVLRVHVRTELKHNQHQHPTSLGRKGAAAHFNARGIFNKYKIPKPYTRAFALNPPAIRKLPPLPSSRDLHSSGEKGTNEQPEVDDIARPAEAYQPFTSPQTRRNTRLQVNVDAILEEEEEEEQGQEIVITTIDGNEDKNKAVNDLDTDSEDESEYHEETDLNIVKSAGSSKLQAITPARDLLQVNVDMFPSKPSTARSDSSTITDEQQLRMQIKSPYTTIVTSKANTPVLSLNSTRTTRKHIGNVFPIDFFIDQERTDILVKMLAESQVPVVCRARFWEEPKGAYFESPECICKCLMIRPEMWKRCNIVSYDVTRRRFAVEWIDDSLPESALTASKSSPFSHLINSKLISEILFEGETHRSLFNQLIQAKALRDDYEFNLAMGEYIRIIRPVIKPKMREFPRELIEGIFAHVKSGREGLPSQVNATLLSYKATTIEHPGQQAVQNAVDMGNALADEETQIKQLMEQEMFASQLLPIYRELKRDYITSQLKSMLLSNEYFLASIPRTPNAFNDTSTAYDTITRIWSSIRVSQDVSADGQLTSALEISKRIAPILNLRVSPSSQEIIGSLRKSIHDLFTTPLLDTMKSHVTRVHPTKKRLQVIDLQAIAAQRAADSTADQSALETRTAHGAPVPVAPTKKTKKSKRQLRAEKMQAQRAAAAAAAAASATMAGKPTASVASTEQSHSASFLSNEIKTTEIHPIQDSTGGISFTAGDFLDMCEWLQIDFDTTFREQLPIIVNVALRQLLEQFGLREPDGAHIPLKLTLEQRSQRVVEIPEFWQRLHTQYMQQLQQEHLRQTGSAMSPAQIQAAMTLQDIIRSHRKSNEELFVRAGKLLTVMTQTVASPIVGSRIMETYKAVEHAQLHVKLSLSYKDPFVVAAAAAAAYAASVEQHAAKDRHRGHGDKKPSKRGALINAHEVAPPPAPPANHTLEYDVSLDDLGKYLKSRLLIWIRPVPCVLPSGIHSSLPQNHNFIKFLFTDLVDDSIEACKLHHAQLTSRIISLVSQASIIPTLTNSLDQYIDANRQSLEHVYAIQKIIEAIQRGLNQNISSRADAVIEKCKSFFALQPPKTFEETKHAMKVLHEMSHTTDWVREQTAWLARLKQFLEEQSWTQTDQEFSKLLQVRQIQDSFLDFLQMRDQDIRQVGLSLLTTLNMEIDQFLDQWTIIDAEADAMFRRNVHVKALTTAQPGIMSRRPSVSSDQPYLQMSTNRPSRASQAASTIERQGSDDELLKVIGELPESTTTNNLSSSQAVPRLSVSGSGQIEASEEDQLGGSAPLDVDTLINSMRQEQRRSKKKVIVASFGENGGTPTFSTKDLSTSQNQHRSLFKGAPHLRGLNAIANDDIEHESPRSGQSSANPNTIRLSSVSLAASMNMTISNQDKGSDPYAAAREIMEIEDPKTELIELKRKLEGSSSHSKNLLAKMQCLENMMRLSEMDAVTLKISTRMLLIDNLIRLGELLDRWRDTPIARLSIEEIAATSTEMIKFFEDSTQSSSPIVKIGYDDLRLFMQVEQPLLVKLKNPIFHEDHWEQIRKILGFDFVDDKNSLREIIHRSGHIGMPAIVAQIEPIELSASKEHAITNTIKEINERYLNMSIELESNNRFGLTVVKSLSNYISSIESDLLTV